MRNDAMLDNALHNDGLRNLRGRLNDPSPEDIREVAEQFEAVFGEMMLKSMRAATPGDDIFGGNAEETYRQLFDRQLALEMSGRGGGLGLADMIEQELRQNMGMETDDIVGGPQTLDDYRRQAIAVPPAPSQEDDARGPGSGQDDARYGDAGAVGSVPTSLGDKGAAWDSPAEFVEAIGPAARETAERLGVPPAALVAQAALETGWGQHVIQRDDGESSNNLFNIKAHTASWQGDRVRVPTLEYRGGIPQREMAEFRAYDSVEQSFEDYADFLESNPRYREALANGEDAGTFVRALQDAGYATDPHYADKLNRIIDQRRADHVQAGGESLKVPGLMPR